MAKIDIPDISSQFESQAGLNNRFTLIENEFNDKVLYRDNPTGEPNQMENDLDMNGNKILNAIVVDPVTQTEASLVNYDDTNNQVSSGSTVQAVIESLDGYTAGLATPTFNNVGGGSEVLRDQTASDINLRTLVAGANVTLNQTADTIEIISTGGGGGASEVTATNTTTYTTSNSTTGEITLPELDLTLTGRGWWEFEAQLNMDTDTGGTQTSDLYFDGDVPGADPIYSLTVSYADLAGDIRGTSARIDVAGRITLPALISTSVGDLQVITVKGLIFSNTASSTFGISMNGNPFNPATLFSLLPGSFVKARYYQVVV